MELSSQVDIFLFLFVGTLGMFLLSGSIVGVFILYQKKLFKQQLLFLEMETGYKEELVHSNIQQVEEERKRISRDLHDEIGGFFSTLNVKLSQLGGAYKPSANSVKLIDECKELIDAGIKSIRRISHNMIPPALEVFGLATTLEVFCAQQASDKVEVEFSAAESGSEPTVKQGLALYRIVQELFSNTIRYANASIVTVQLINDASKLTLKYSDNGNGFNMDTTEHKKGIGLRNIYSRVNMINGTIHYETAPGKGVVVIIELSYT